MARNEDEGPGSIQKVITGPFLSLRSLRVGSISPDDLRSSHRFPMTGNLRVPGGSLLSSSSFRFGTMILGKSKRDVSAIDLHYEVTPRTSFKKRNASLASDNTLLIAYHKVIIDV
ncbi:hypothetical protein LIER_14493 [Lithospermum erythrorhizon]|uniref:Uncharacterized protein n=1 Tax=Lithospermum erythrorhizon TaxID=34254 RepID=A0AAV3Q0Z2_LITER